MGLRRVRNKKRIVLKSAEVQVTLPYLEHPLPFRPVGRSSVRPKQWKGRSVTKRTELASRKRRMVTYDMGKMSAALSESTQDQQSDKGGRSNPCQKKKKKEKRSYPKQRSPLSSRRRARKAKKHKDKKRRKSFSTSTSASSKDSSESTSSFDSEDRPPEHPAS